MHISQFSEESYSKFSQNFPRFAFFVQTRKKLTHGLLNLLKNMQKHHGRPQGGVGKLPPPRNRKKIVVDKWCYFPELYKMTEVLEEGIENG